MTRSIPYHRQQDGLVLSLKYLNTSEERLFEVRDDLQENIGEEIQFTSTIESFYPDNTVHALYSAYDHPKRIPDGWEEEVPDEDLPLVDAIINTFLGVSQDWEARNNPLKWYKRFDPINISDAFRDIQWRQRVPNVGGEIVSRLMEVSRLKPRPSGRGYSRQFLHQPRSIASPDIPRPHRHA